MLGAVARDAESGRHWQEVAAAKPGSDMAKLLKALDREGDHGSQGVHGSVMFVAAEALRDALFEGHVEPKRVALAALGAGGAYLLNDLRQAGIRRAADLYREAMLDPELARRLISGMPATAESGALPALARTLKRGLILGPMAVDGTQGKR